MKLAETGAQDADLRLDRMVTLIDNNNLPSPGAAVILDALHEGIPIPGTRKSIPINLKPLAYSKDAQEFDKLSKDFLKNVKSFVGSQVTQGEIQMFLDTVPTLMQSDEGKKAVIRNMKILNRINHNINQATEAIIEEHGGRRPHDLQRLVEQRVKPEREKLGIEFKNGIGDSVGLAKEATGGKIKHATRKSYIDMFGF